MVLRFVSREAQKCRRFMSFRLVIRVIARRRQLMNFVLVTTAGIPVLVALGCYL